MSDWDDEPEYRADELPNFYKIINAPLKFRNKRLLEFTHNLLYHGTPSKVVDSLITGFYWNLDNSEPVVGYRKSTFEKWGECEKDKLISDLVKLYIDTQCDWPDWFRELEEKLEIKNE